MIGSRTATNNTGQVAPADPAALESWVSLVSVYTRRLMRAAAGNGDEGGAGDVRLLRVFEKVTADFAYPWTVDELAHRAGVSGEHLRRLCQAEWGCGPMRRVTELRMRHAASLLSTGAYTVERAAAQVGYDNPFTFSAAFKRLLGRPPSAFCPPASLRH